MCWDLHAYMYVRRDEGFGLERKGKGPAGVPVHMYSIRELWSIDDDVLRYPGGLRMAQGLYAR